MAWVGLTSLAYQLLGFATFALLIRFVSFGFAIVLCYQTFQLLSKELQAKEKKAKFLLYPIPLLAFAMFAYSFRLSADVLIDLALFCSGTIFLMALSNAYLDTVKSHG